MTPNPADRIGAPSAAELDEAGFARCERCHVIYDCDEGCPWVAATVDADGWAAYVRGLRTVEFASPEDVVAAGWEVD